MISYGPGLVFPDAWGGRPEEELEEPGCPVAGCPGPELDHTGTCAVGCGLDRASEECEA